MMGKKQRLNQKILVLKLKTLHPYILLDKDFVNLCKNILLWNIKNNNYENKYNLV